MAKLLPRREVKSKKVSKNTSHVAHTELKNFTLLINLIATPVAAISNRLLKPLKA